MAPIKRLLSIKNTCHRKIVLFFVGSSTSVEINLFVCLHPVFQVFGTDLSLICNQAPLKIKFGSEKNKSPGFNG
jgi:hypothetical protein